jgi:PAS domain-containing protein
MAEESLLSELFEAHPTATFLADDDVHLLLANRAAKALLGPGERLMLDEPRRGGDLLHCSHTTDHPEGCGRGEHCRTCVVRGAVCGALADGAVTRRRGELELRRGDAIQRLQVLVSATPIVQDGVRLALLTIELPLPAPALPVLPG